MRSSSAILATMSSVMLMMGLAAIAPATADKVVRVGGQWRFKHRLTVTEMPTPQKDKEARIFRRDHRDKD